MEDTSAEISPDSQQAQAARGELSGKRARRSVETFDPSTASKRSKPETEEYEVEAILDKRVVGAGSATKTEYLVHWKGYTADEDTWEPKQELKNVQPLIVAFESGRGKKSPSSNLTE